MNTLPEDNNVFKEFEVTYRRPLRRFTWFVWVMIAAIFVQTCFAPTLALPRTIKLAMIIGTTAIMLFGVFGFLWWLVPRHPLVKQMRPAARRLGKRFACAMTAYFITFAAATWYNLHRHPVLMALAPSLPILFTIRAMMLFLKEESDEFLRARMLEGWATATGLMLAVCTVWGFLDQFEVVPHLPMWAAFPLWACSLVPAHFLLQRREA